MNLRKTHRLIAIIILLPLIMMVVTGLTLQLRNQFEWIQPKTIKSELTNAPFITPEEIIRIANSDVEQIIYRPAKNNISVRLKSGIESQYNAQTGALLKSAPRRSGLLIELHQGSWMGGFGQYFIHLIAGLGLLFLMISGIMIWPLGRKRKL
jgi:uncharacterized iron-regulated membrane protein